MERQFNTVVAMVYESSIVSLFKVFLHTSCIFFIKNYIVDY